MNYLNFLLLLMISSFMFNCTSERSLSGSDIDEITSLDQQFARGWFANNPQDSVLSAFEENAVFIPHHGGEPVLGKQNIREFFWPKDIGGIVHKFNHYPDAIDGNNEVAWVRGKFDLKYSWIIEGDTTTTLNAGNYVMVCRKASDNKWKIATFIFNDPLADTL